MCEMRKDTSLDLCSGAIYIYVEVEVIQSLESLTWRVKKKPAENAKATFVTGCQKIQTH